MEQQTAPQPEGGRDAPSRYRSDVEDSTRWHGFPFRPGDIVISAPSKSGTTWTQMMCALLVFGTPDLPAPLSQLSPWLDMRVRPIEDVRRRLDEQQHRRFIKSHTPLDGIPYDDQVSYIAVCRDPRDVVVSLLHHGQNLRRDKIRSFVAATDVPGQPVPASEPGQEPLVGSAALLAGASAGAELDIRNGILRWMRSDTDPHQNLDTLRGFAWQLGVAWSRRRFPNVLLLHYSDLKHDLDGEMHRLAEWLHVGVDGGLWPSLVEAASFDTMRAASSSYVPDEGLDFFHDTAAFFRGGGSRQWERLLTGDDLREYDERLAALAPPDLVAWMHH